MGALSLRCRKTVERGGTMTTIRPGARQAGGVLARASPAAAAAVWGVAFLRECVIYCTALVT